ncbi:acetyl-CoA carboxylase biotin carboxyl carrier protein subunit [Aquimarina sp. BL5]|uniref:acetyl-CoA carboxylase biotin carboxyl carrier protein subunit n=1 Tax=Aquimarina sp. BL5 TaxID=1714860 RepID=UPI000E4CB520|nr:acetyl-CoA carboxylase biotin carboxyl carrier protein subunit [Aquimarina sp. BL5]AXT50438.1 acetyl-CoA carboxylase biotin carboxyl carrier protein subunit [Aquimarina sp. BL5]RKN03086.1 acetyl-CoA carboxylase biotin carboxyl carrier protein subunit [Aquimarina sp. BL5]
MSTSYKVKVNKNFEAMISEEDISKTNIVKTSDSKFHILEEHQSYHTEIIKSDFNDKKYTVKVNANTYEVDIANSLDMMISEMGFSIGASKQVNSIKSPMPGLIIDIQVVVGQTVKEDDYLLVLEAMKMENIITSPREGIIKSIDVAKGDAVDKGKLLIEFE